MITFERTPPYRHWRIDIDTPYAFVAMAVDPAGGLHDGYELKLNTYDWASISSSPTSFNGCGLSIRRSRSSSLTSLKDKCSARAPIS